MNVRKIHLLIAFVFASAPAWAETPPAEALYVGAISIEPCQDAKILADWYAVMGFATKEFKGGYYAKLDTPAGPLFFGIHRKKADAPAKSSASVSIVFHVENFEARLASLKSKGLTPDSTESDPSEGQFAHFHDPDGNSVTIWGK
jgi:predicted enzyme related to lactoylglutathione lyase